MIDSELNYQNCTSCGIPRTLDYMNGKGVCEFCKPMEPIYEDEDFIQVVSDDDFPHLQECPKCGSEFYSSDNSAVCTDCLNKV